jgi:ketosteroid isomerase-like protein
VKAAIDAGNKAFAEAVAKGDATACGAFYTATAKAFPPNAGPVEGREAITKLWSGLLASGIRSLTLAAGEVEGHGDTVHEVGSYLLKTPDGQIADQGKYIVVWKKEDGRWKQHRDIWNSSLPSQKP